MVFKDDDNKYYMYYSGIACPPLDTDAWDIGFAVADNPLGPWKKYDKNPVLEDFGYLNSVVKVNGKYYLYTAHPVGSIAYDYSPFSVAVADSLTGPWEIYSGNPILKQGQPGEWDDGGFSESEVLYQNGVFHTFYGGARTHPNRMLTREDLGYAYSFDGFKWIKYGLNPIARLDNCPPVASFAEVHTIMEPPFIYIYHTQRYTHPCTINGKHRDPADEDLGVQVLVTQKPFSLTYPLMQIDSVAPGKTTTLEDCPLLPLANISKLAITAELTYAKNANSHVRLHVRSSFDGLNYDTGDLYTYDCPVEKGKTVRHTFLPAPNVKFLKVLVQNFDGKLPVKNVKITAVLGG